MTIAAAVLTTLAALSTGKAILIGIASGAVLVLLVIGAQASVRRPRRRPELDIPPGMKPGPSDPEKTVKGGPVLARNTAERSHRPAACRMNVGLSASAGKR